VTPSLVALDAHGRVFWLRAARDAADPAPTIWRDDPPAWTQLAAIAGARGLCGARVGVHVLAPPGLHRLGAGNRAEPAPLTLDLGEVTGFACAGDVAYLAGPAGITRHDLDADRGRAVTRMSSTATSALVARPDGHVLYAAAGRAIMELTLPDGAEATLVELPAPITALAHTPAGLAAIAGGALHGINTRQRRHIMIRALPAALAAASLAAHHRGDLLLATATTIHRCYGDGSDLHEVTPPGPTRP
jgi:hypothetical protein